jgi:hypothetical protein
MVEIAICIAIIAFALVGIVGLLPRGLQTQRDSRATTIVGQDALYWLEAIRSGSRGLDELTNYVECIEIGTNAPAPLTFGRGFTNGYGIVGSLCTEGSRNRAVVRAISGSAVDRADSVKDLAFRYVMDVDIYRAKDNTFPTNLLVSPSRLWNVRLSFRWPVRGPCPITSDRIGSYSRIVRSVIASRLLEETDSTQTYFFFEP